MEEANESGAQGKRKQNYEYDLKDMWVTLKEMENSVRIERIVEIGTGQLADCK